MPALDFGILPAIPLDEEGPVFKAPWEAQAFALVVSLQEQGVFSWYEWSQAMNQSIEIARDQGDADLGNTYYQHWLLTLETMTIEKGLASTEDLANHKQTAFLEHQRLHQDHTHHHH
ncbi:MAG: nitrile hydratase accessory protein [Halioglobus sp.]|jgi:nitrile hydratase accessory protein